MVSKVNHVGAHPDSRFSSSPSVPRRAVEVPRNSELPLEIAVVIDFEAVPFATLAGEVMGRRTLSREPTTVDGREAVRIEGVSTGEGLYDRGTRSYRSVVDLEDRGYKVGHEVRKGGGLCNDKPTPAI